jgi:UDP-N-acetyl-D-mannosaminuronic acid dehydrogenase
MRVPIGHPDRHVCIIGLGYVGLTLAVAMADVGFRVHGVERSQEILSCLKQSRATFVETGLDERLAARIADGSFTFSETIPTGHISAVFIITVGTPLEKGQKSTDLASIRTVSDMVADALRPGDLVILRSTVRVGVSRDVVKPILDKAGVAFDLAFCPERTLEGSALRELRTLPQIVAGLDETSCLRATQLFNFLTPTTVMVHDLETAEMVKLINNTQRDLLFAFANEVAHFCDVVGVSAPEVINAGNMGYERGYMPRPGPVGGPCLEKDPYILAEGLALRGGSAPIALASRRTNEDLPRVVAQRLAGELFASRPERPSKITVVGLAFKGRPETSDLRGSLAFPLIAELKKAVPLAVLFGFDPAVAPDQAVTMGVNAARSIEEAFAGADLVVFQNNNPRFERLSLFKLAATMAPGGLIYDMWNQFDPDQLILPHGIRYAGLGSWVLLQRSTKALVHLVAG